MVYKMHLTFIFFASSVFISSVYTLSPPTDYSWPQNSKNLCFIGHFDLVLNVNYLQSNGNKATAKVQLDNSTYESYSVSCSEPSNIHQLTLSMLNGFTNIVFKFSVDASNVTSLVEITSYITFNNKQKYFENYSPDLEGLHVFSSNQSLFTTERGSSYRCNTKTIIKGFDQNGNVTLTSIDLENLRIESFADDSKEFSDYGVEKVCSADLEKNSNLIPIIVGSCLAVLVIIVLVAYLIGRRRSRNGYQSV